MKLTLFKKMELTDEDFVMLEEQLLMETNLAESSVLLPFTVEMFDQPQLAEQLKEADKILEEFLTKSQMDATIVE
jgi:sulfur relay (sulfurtransferase) DsrF/TusC family protein